MRSLSRQEAIDLLVGCAILSTGGGGSLTRGLKIINEDYDNGLKYRLASSEDILDDGYYTSPYYCGSIGPIDESKDPYYSYQPCTEVPTILAVKALECYLNKPISGIVSIEYGGSSTSAALSTAARLNKIMVDGDAAGRAVPELQFSTFFINKKPISPFALVTTIGEKAVFTDINDDARAEVLARTLACVSGGYVAITDHLISGAELKESVIMGALSQAEKVGRAQREAVEKGLDPIGAIIEAADGYKLFEGVVKQDCEWCVDGGFTIGTTEINGIGIHKNDNFKVWFKNENMILWKNDQPWITCPDLICLVDGESGYPVLNPYWTKGAKVVGLGFKSPAIWRTHRGLSILNPRFFGFDIDWHPIEEVLK